MTTLAMRGVRPGTKRADRPARRGNRGRLTLWVWLFLLPTAILYGLYTLYPIAASYWYSLVEWNGFESQQRFVGLANYQAVFADPMFWSSFKITLIFMLLVAPARVILSFLLAIVLNSPKLPLARLFRTAFFLPVVTTTAIVGVVMQFVLDPASGPLNSLLLALGHDGGISFLGDSQTALITASVVYIWKFFGITLVYWLAALQTIPTELYEAARIDGAGVVQLFTQITVPLLKPFLIIISLLTIEDSFRAFDLMQTLTGGGPFFATEVIEIYIYQRAFTAPVPQLGFASAAAVLFGLFVFVVGLIQLWGVWAARRLRAGA
ncbi:carbohydrate ABC transporter permease [Microlunatus sp. GCM10028923]|uniref:carbohydrate ABC transporter permease n=1 Tax=Microlunatus sp. GCM10028923 TaxID=3273400 RepID=UPI003608D513